MLCSVELIGVTVNVKYNRILTIWRKIAKY